MYINIYYTDLKIENFAKKLFLKKLHTQKNGPSGASGPASASLWRAERGTLPSKIVKFFAAVVGGPYGKKTIFRIKVSQCRKTETGTLWGF